MFMEPKPAAAVPPADAAATPVEPPAPLALKEGAPAGEKPRILEDVVIEEVSIDGMCGVY